MPVYNTDPYGNSISGGSMRDWGNDQGDSTTYGDDAGELGPYNGTPTTETVNAPWQRGSDGNYYYPDGTMVPPEVIREYYTEIGSRNATGAKYSNDVVSPGWYPGQDTSRSDQFRDQQYWLTQQLQNQIRGNGPTVAGQQFQRDLSAAIANAVGQSRSNPNISPAMQARIASMATGNMAQSAAGQAAQLRAAEQMAAMGLLNQAAGGARGQDIGIAGSNQEMQMRAALANQQGQQWQQEMLFREAQAKAAAEQAKKDWWLKLIGIGTGAASGIMQGMNSGAGGGGGYGGDGGGGGGGSTGTNDQTGNIGSEEANAGKDINQAPEGVDQEEWDAYQEAEGGG